MAFIEQKIGFIGAGNMGEAMIGAIIGADLVSPDRIMACDINPERLELIQQTYKVMVETDPARVFNTGDIIVLAVKPQQMTEVLTVIAGADSYKIQQRKQVISIAAGIRLEKIESILYPRLNEEERAMLPIIRVMPNTPALVLAGISGISPNRYAKSDDLELTKKVILSMGKVYECPESALDAVTAVSGSGPAYCFYFIEAMIQGAVNAGLSPSDAELLTVATFKGALKLMVQRAEPAEVLRQKVTSPGGTTEAALKVMQAGNVKQNIAEAIVAAANRSKELSLM